MMTARRRNESDDNKKMNLRDSGKGAGMTMVAAKAKLPNLTARSQAWLERWNRCMRYNQDSRDAGMTKMMAKNHKLQWRRRWRLINYGNRKKNRNVGNDSRKIEMSTMMTKLHLWQKWWNRRRIDNIDSNWTRMAMLAAKTQEWQWWQQKHRVDNV